MDSVIHLVDVLAVAVFAISGALAAAEKKLDILGFILFGIVTGIGGGTARDLLLGTDTVFWVSDNLYLWMCIGAAVATWFLAPLLTSLHRVLLWADAVGLALFCVLGTIKAQAWGASPLVAVVMGMMTATFGSVIRDTLLNQEPVLLGPEIYVTAALLGSTGYIVLDALPATAALAMPLAIALAFMLRAAAILFGLRLPKYGKR
ncbi:MAG: trimeric intracellular cation channel family protein [Pseudomonadales bacterium]|nr:trimeric intracellular cation channel family protein [Halioglobus sp.]MCP5129669.1 trimeric intracellular cation channel family protein [Pseudomonadales bacterium]